MPSLTMRARMASTVGDGNDCLGNRKLLPRSRVEKQPLKVNAFCNGRFADYRIEDKCLKIWRYLLNHGHYHIPLFLGTSYFEQHPEVYWSFKKRVYERMNIKTGREITLTQREILRTHIVYCNITSSMQNNKLRCNQKKAADKS